MEYCVQCGNAISEGAKFCHKCGTPVKGETQVKTGTVPPPGSRGCAYKPVETQVKTGTVPSSSVRGVPVLACKQMSKKQKTRLLTSTVGPGFLAVAAAIFACVTYEPANFLHGTRINWFMIIAAVLCFIEASIYGFLFAQADKYHIEIFEGHIEGLSLCLTGGIHEINVPYTQVQGVTVAEKQCALVLQLVGRQETMYCPDADTARQMRQYINDRIRASYQ